MAGACAEHFEMRLASNDDGGDGLPNQSADGGLIIPVLSPPAAASSPSPVVDSVDPTVAAEVLADPSLKETPRSGDDNNDAKALGARIAAADPPDETLKPPKKDHDDDETTKRISRAKPSDKTTDASRDASLPGKKSKVDHNYRDFSAIGVMEAKIFSKSTANDNKTKAGTSFPEALHRILSQPAYSKIISWRPHGRAWVVLNETLLVNEVLSRFDPKLAVRFAAPGAFTRHLHEWGFKRLYQQGSDNGAYYHECFLLGKPHLSIFMELVRGRVEMMPDIKCEPNFEAIALKSPLSGHSEVGLAPGTSRTRGTIPLAPGTAHLAPVTHQPQLAKMHHSDWKNIMQQRLNEHHNRVSNYTVAPNFSAPGLYAGFTHQPRVTPGVQTFVQTAVPQHLGYIIQQPGVVPYGLHSNFSAPWPQVFSHQLGTMTTHSVHPYVAGTAHAGTMINATAAPRSASQEMQLGVKSPKMRVKKQTVQKPKRRKRVPKSKDVKTAASSDLQDEVATAVAGAMLDLPEVSREGANQGDKAGQSSSLQSSAADASLSPENYYAEV